MSIYTFDTEFWPFSAVRFVEEFVCDSQSRVKGYQELKPSVGFPQPPVDSGHVRRDSPPTRAGPIGERLDCFLRVAAQAGEDV